MILRQYYLGCLSQASYLVGDEATGRAALVDPRRDVEEYVRDAEELGLVIDHVFLTHFHADFVAGHLEVRARTGADIRMGARARPEFDWVAMREGDALVLGSVRLEVLETPGHTPESICLLVRDGRAPAGAPGALLTGDTLFIGDVGRPDLMASEGESASSLAALLYESVHGKLLRLPEETLVYPGHGAGSLCGKNLGTETVSTIAEQRRTNPALQPMTREAFLDLVTRDLPEAPAYFALDAKLNRENRELLERSLEKEAVGLGADEFLAWREAGAQLLDARDGDEFARSHIRGSLQIGLGGTYASWAGTFLDWKQPVILVAPAGSEREAVMRLGRIGLDSVRGYLDGGVAVLRDRPGLLAQAERCSTRDLAEARRRTPDLAIVDVRTPREREAGSFPGALHLPLAELPRRVGEVPRGRRIVVHCSGGYRSPIAASLLRRAGLAGVVDLRDGFDAWKREGREAISAAAGDVRTHSGVGRSTH